ncbi:hypothetical protein [Larsenimonas rhizosphaerae]|uniref:Uncharacterized protein n=1 Tax=Larsenimonas rhizosphaerae TaxID=2944682 RepID=A0AA41ZJM4_9GAMM|nr:hypothetical protein [Larsenimonas rhizosphaerae]MCX2525494.1 hypothetical protein [Larsenimonas rhizosphaerae]
MAEQVGLSNVSDMLAMLQAVTSMSVSGRAVDFPYRKNGKLKTFQIKLGRFQIPETAGSNGFVFTLPEAFDTSFDYVFVIDRGNGANSVACEVVNIGQFRAFGRAGSGDNPFALTSITYLAFGGMS